MGYYDRQLEYDRLFSRIYELAEKAGDRRMLKWLRFYRANDHRIPSHPGSAIEKMAIVLMKEYLEVNDA